MFDRRFTRPHLWIGLRSPHIIAHRLRFHSFAPAAGGEDDIIDAAGDAPYHSAA